MLTSLNDALHADLEQGLLRTLEALTALDMAAVEAGWSRFVAALEAHKCAEDAAVFPRYAQLGPFERGGSPELLDADHRSIDKVLGACHEALAEVRAAPEPARRRAMVEHLGRFVRLRSVLEHHGLREQRLCYPRLDEALPAAERQALADLLSAPPATGPAG